MPTALQPAAGSSEDTRSWVYRELGGLFDRLPEALERGPAESACYPRTARAARRLCEEYPRHSRTALEAELVRLCVNAPGGVPAPPYASYYLDGTLLGPARDWAAEQYRSQGLESDPRAGQPADFIAIEFEYLYFLCRHQRAARLTGDARARSAASRAEAVFFRDHLARWLPPFTRDLASAAAPGGVFARVAELLEAYCEEERARLEAR